IIAWAEKFKMEQVESANAPQSWFLNMVEGSRGLIRLRKRVFRPASEWLAMRFARQHHEVETDTPPPAWKVRIGRAIAAVAVCAVLYAAVHATGMVSQLTRDEYRELLSGACATFLRVVAALVIGSL